MSAGDKKLYETAVALRECLPESSNKATQEEIDVVLADKAYWQQLESILGGKLAGCTDRISAIFAIPHNRNRFREDYDTVAIDTRMAELLLTQQKKIDFYKRALRNRNRCR